MTGARRLVTIALALVAVALVLAVVVKYWPPEVERVVADLLGSAGDRAAETWRRVGGRWMTLVLVALGTGLGLLVVRRVRWAGLLIIEVSIVGGAIVALLQPEGW